MKRIPFYLTAIIILLSGCCRDKDKQEDNFLSISALPSTESGYVVADTIIYDVIIKNLNSGDKWTEKCLKNLKKEQFIDKLFESVYNEKAVAYDLNSNNIITSDDLKSMEKKKEINRNRIGKIQFTEAWLFNDSLLIFTKKVLSASLGMEVYDEKGELIGYKHIFKLLFN